MAYPNNNNAYIPERINEEDEDAYIHNVDYEPEEEEEEEDPEEDPEEEPEEENLQDELDDDAELMVDVYDVAGNETPPPRADDETVATVGTITRKPSAVRDFPPLVAQFMARGESSRPLIRDEDHDVDRLEPWVLRRDLDATNDKVVVITMGQSMGRARMDLMESRQKIANGERQLLRLDVERIEKDLKFVMETLTKKEVDKNAKLKKKLEAAEIKLDLERMRRESAERKLKESYDWNHRFYSEMIRQGAVPPPEDNDDKDQPTKKARKSPKDGDEGPSDPR